jgi:hypothetical protein
MPRDRQQADEGRSWRGRVLGGVLRSARGVCVWVCKGVDISSWGTHEELGTTGPDTHLGQLRVDLGDDWNALALFLFVRSELHL